MRYIEEIEISGFRCYEQTQLCLQDLTILTGPNNSGKSAFLHLIRRFVSANINRHPARGTPGGAAFYGSEHHLRLVTRTSRSEHCTSSMSMHRTKAGKSSLRPIASIYYLCGISRTCAVQR